MPPVSIQDDASTASFNVHEHNESMARKEPLVRKVERRHSVGFVPEQKVIEFESDDIPEAIWYTRDEYDIIKARNSLIIKMMKTGSFEESDEHTFRGLEHKLKDGFKQRRENKFNALNAVLEEQDRQYNRGSHDPEVIARAYRRVSLNAAESAFVLACKDAEESYCSEGKTKHGSLLGYMDNDSDSDDSSSLEEELDEDDETDADTVNSEDTQKKKTRLRRLFNGISNKRKDKMYRRTSM